MNIEEARKRFNEAKETSRGLRLIFSKLKKILDEGEDHLLVNQVFLNAEDTHILLDKGFKVETSSAQMVKIYGWTTDDELEPHEKTTIKYKGE